MFKSGTSIDRKMFFFPAFNRLLLLTIFFLVANKNTTLAASKTATGDKPQSVAALLTLGNSLYQQSRFKKAYQVFYKAAKLEPKQAEIHYYLGRSAYGAGSYYPAALAFRNSLKIKPDSIVEVCLAESYTRLQKQVEKKQPDLAENYERRANHYFKHALSTLQKQLKQNSTNSKLYNALGRAAMGLSDYSVAVPAFEKVLESKPQNATARTILAAACYRLGLLQSEQGKQKEAKETFGKSLQHFTILYELFLNSRPEKKLPKPGEPQYATFSLLNLNLAQAASASGNYSRAEKVYRRILKANPQDSGTWTSLASLLRRTGQKKTAKQAYLEAQKCLQQKVAKEPKKTDLLMSLARVASGAGDYGAAISAYEKAIQVNQRLYMAHLGLAQTYKTKGNTEKAKKVYLKAFYLMQEEFMKNPTNIGINYFMANAAIGAENYEGAVVAYERILSSSPELDRVRMDLAAAYALLKAYDLAKVEFKKIIETSKNELLRQTSRSYLKSMTAAEKKNFILGSFSTSYTFDSNPRANPNSNVIKTVAGNVTLDKEANSRKRDASNGYSAMLRHIFITPLKPLQWRSTFVWFGTHYHMLDRQDVNYYTVKSGPGITIGKLDIELIALINAMEQDMRTYSKGHGFETNLFYPVNKHLSIGVNYKLENKKLYQDRNTDVRNHSITLRPNIVWGKKNQHWLALTFTYETEYNQSGGDYRTGRDANSGAGATTTRYKDTFHAKFAGFKYSYKLPWWGLTPYLGGSIRDLRYTARSTLFAKPRKDRVSDYRFGISKKLPQKFSLEISHIRTHSYSNTDLYKYRRNQTTFTLTKDF